MDRKTLTPVAHSNIAVVVGAISFYVEHFVTARARKLVVALDIGTVFSGAACAFLEPGETPQIQSVTRHAFPPIFFTQQRW